MAHILQCSGNCIWQNERIRTGQLVRRAARGVSSLAVYHGTAAPRVRWRRVRQGSVGGCHYHRAPEPQEVGEAPGRPVPFPGFFSRRTIAGMPHLRPGPALRSRTVAEGCDQRSRIGCVAQSGCSRSPPVAMLGGVPCVAPAQVRATRSARRQRVAMVPRPHNSRRREPRRSGHAAQARARRQSPSSAGPPARPQPRAGHRWRMRDKEKNRSERACVFRLQSTRLELRQEPGPSLALRSKARRLRHRPGVKLRATAHSAAHRTKLNERDAPALVGCRQGPQVVPAGTSRERAEPSVTSDVNAAG